MQPETQQSNPQTLFPAGGLTIQDAFQLLSVRVHAQFSPKTDSFKPAHPAFSIAETSKCS